MTTKKCIWCKKEFKPHHHCVKLCSDRCGELHRKERMKKYRSFQKEYRNRRRKQDPGREYRSLKRRRPWKVVFDSKRSNAKKKGIEFSLTPEWFEKNYKKGCNITSLPFKLGEGSICPYSATVDRINPKKGYVPRNCRMILHAVNALRGTGTDRDMKKIAEAIIN